MDIVLKSLAGLGSFAIYFAISLVILLLFQFIYTLVTTHDEWQQVKEQHNVAAAIAIAGAGIGFSIALAGAASNSVSLIDFIVWGIVALIAQIVAVVIVRLALLPKVEQRINDGEISASIILGGVSIAIGLLNAACMTY